ncbi:hypothetical protein A3B26_00930 [Candidatus Giovannonibacteria bacterium RIFCSPLOWO2_01_FULL_48_47]|nr:MAG: hypothetical protein A3D61_03680 [Candidatus Giovannonibacteria bacterium RIFCSPHIGHO2_02_FULL_48_15]OGF88032.1 MAG: hypothetical protein A3B26_00930 [Candidatus Giovannonibacteria bacterium RIFCSPLOWO2_01_FULL_48_47]OGF94846.1 MAG: hypothetical protein A2433_02450 [Candidatus Giovannonibacteria bacterium RIFOXYC1_FULL_48_8]OGF95873.1 MAG: hypothetical protein A2613_03580 [Candidatus Giovannonibacteria bacterium RIFOXYD1_FULL_48_21]
MTLQEKSLNVKQKILMKKFLLPLRYRLCFLPWRCDKALAAADFSAADEYGFLKTFEALLAAFLPVVLGCAIELLLN